MYVSSHSLITADLYQNRDLNREPKVVLDSIVRYLGCPPLWPSPFH